MKNERIIELGYFPKNSLNGRYLTWIVLEEKEGKALLMSEQHISEKTYHTEVSNGREVDYDQLTWSRSTIRKYLNDHFFNNAFTDDEKAIIIKTPLSNPVRDFRSDIIVADEKTEDMVFLLGLDDDVFSKHASINWTGKQNNSWWLRSTYSDKRAAEIRYNDDYESIGICASTPSSDNYVRPMITIDYHAYENRKARLENIIKEKLDDYWSKRSDEKQRLLQKRESLEERKKGLINKNGELTTIDITGLINKLGEHIQGLEEKANSPHAKKGEKEDLQSYINKARDYIEQLKPIEEETRENRSEFESICSEIDKIDSLFENAEQKIRKNVYDRDRGR